MGFITNVKVKYVARAQRPMAGKIKCTSAYYVHNTLWDVVCHPLEVDRGTLNV